MSWQSTHHLDFSSRLIRKVRTVMSLSRKRYLTLLKQEEIFVPWAILAHIYIGIYYPEESPREDSTLTAWCHIACREGKNKPFGTGFISEQVSS